MASKPVKPTTKSMAAKPGKPAAKSMASKQAKPAAKSMASKTAREELTLALDWDFLDACNGYTFDMGGSVMKVAYISKDDWVEPSKRKKGSKGCIRLVNFSREEFDDAIKYINTKARLIKNPSTGLVDIYSTGYGGTQFADKFKKELLTSQSPLSETDCFVQSFLHLAKNLPRKDVVYPISKEAMKLATTETEQYVHFAKLSKDTGESAMYDLPECDKMYEPLNFPDPESIDPDKPLTQNKDLFPCIVMMLGSGYGAFVIHEDGSFQLGDMSVRGGRMFLGLGSLLTGGKNYQDIMKLSEIGDLGKVTVTIKSIQADVKVDMGSNKEKKEDVYSAMLDIDMADQPLFSFGYAAGKTIDDFKKEDMARALLQAQVSDVVQVAYSAAVVNGAKHVFFAGGFVNNPFAREVFNVEWHRRDGIIAMIGPGKKNHIQGHFMIHAQSLGAIGALLNHKMQWYEKRKAKATAKAAPAAGNKNKNSKIKDTVGL